MSRFRLNREGFFSPLGLHAAGFGILAIAVIVLGVRVGLDWRTTSASNADAIASRQSELKALQLQTAPLRGLDKKVVLSREQIDGFYAKRVPASWSAVLEQLGDLQKKTQIRLSRVQYTPAPGSGDLSEIRMDAGVSGEYPAIMRFINGLERSKTFFVVRAMQLSGQQNGAVNLRLVVSTWLRPEDAAALQRDIDEQKEREAHPNGAPGEANPNGQGPDGSGPNGAAPTVLEPAPGSAMLNKDSSSSSPVAVGGY